MKIIVPYAAIAIMAAALVAYASNRLAPTHDSGAFSANLLLNIVAELVGVALGVIIGAHVAMRVARKKIDGLAKRVVSLIEQLRLDGALTPLAARNSVRVAVGIISEDAFAASRASDASRGISACRVCALESWVVENRCGHCHLPREVWKDPAAS